MTDEEVIDMLERIVDENEEYGRKYLSDEAIKAVEIATKAFKKQIPIKPVPFDRQEILWTTSYRCPSCKRGITGTNIAKWCYHCGQRIDWRDYVDTE